ncbi:MAG: hypothetical protein Kow0020_11410 [Wenzhouxiangellaceae bacterium]
MRARGLIRLVTFGALSLAPVVAGAWDTAMRGTDLSTSDWRTIYELIPQPGADGQPLLHGNEHAEISALALHAIGADRLLQIDDLPVVVDLNASVFRRAQLFQPDRIASPANAADDGLERRILPPVAQFSGLPDFSYALYDWINKNRLCPLPADIPQRDVCHGFDGWIGAALNASHFGSQATYNYQRLHAVALALAAEARARRERLAHHPGALEAYREHLIEGEWMALAYEGVAQHFLADRWSTGHMWERWNAGAAEDLPTLDLSSNKIVGYLSGLIHGAQSVLHMKPFDALSGESDPSQARARPWNHDQKHGAGSTPAITSQPSARITDSDCHCTGSPEQDSRIRRVKATLRRCGDRPKTGARRLMPDSQGTAKSGA